MLLDALALVSIMSLAMDHVNILEEGFQPGKVHDVSLCAVLRKAFRVAPWGPECLRVRQDPGHRPKAKPTDLPPVD